MWMFSSLEEEMSVPSLAADLKKKKINKNEISFLLRRDPIPSWSEGRIKCVDFSGVYMNWQQATLLLSQPNTLLWYVCPVPTAVASKKPCNESPRLSTVDDWGVQVLELRTDRHFCLPLRPNKNGHLGSPCQITTPPTKCRGRGLASRSTSKAKDWLLLH